VRVTDRARPIQTTSGCGMRIQAWTGILFLTCLHGCGATPDTSQAATHEAASPFTFDRAPNIDPAALPANSDFQMVDLDLEKYALELCGLNHPNTSGVQACDVYVQANKAGGLVGYVALIRSMDGVSIASALTLGGSLSSHHCGISGKLSRSREPGLLTIGDAGRNFNARVAFSAWEKEPGIWLVSADDGTHKVFDDPKGALGMWYFERKGNNLRVQQERWNYCYSDSKIYIDDVYRRVISVLRKAA